MSTNYKGLVVLTLEAWFIGRCHALRSAKLQARGRGGVTKPQYVLTGTKGVPEALLNLESSESHSVGSLTSTTHFAVASRKPFYLYAYYIVLC